VDIDTLKRMLQRLGNQAARPFVEIADDQARMLQLRRQENFAAHQQPPACGAPYIRAQGR